MPARSLSQSMIIPVVIREVTEKYIKASSYPIIMVGLFGIPTEQNILCYLLFVPREIQAHDLLTCGIIQTRQDLVLQQRQNHFMTTRTEHSISRF